MFSCRKLRHHWEEVHREVQTHSEILVTACLCFHPSRPTCESASPAGPNTKLHPQACSARLLAGQASTKVQHEVPSNTERRGRTKCSTLFFDFFLI